VLKVHKDCGGSLTTVRVGYEDSVFSCDYCLKDVEPDDVVEVQPPKHKPWPLGRRKEVHDLRELLQLCSGIRRTTSWHSDIERIERLADQLQDDDLEKCRWGFSMYLKQVACGDELP
jgi:hypothetical protein